MQPEDIKFLMKHSAIYGVGTVINQLVGFFMLPMYTKYLTPKDYGMLQLIEITTFLLGMVITTGIAQTLSRFYYDHNEMDKRNKIVSTMYITYCLMALCACPFLFLLAPILSSIVLDSPSYVDFFYISFLSFILGGLFDIGLTYLRIIDKSISFIFITTSQLIMLLSLNIYFIAFKEMGILGILYSILITRIFYQFVLTVPILFKIKLRFSLAYSLQILRFILPLIPARIANTFINQSDKYFIRYFISIADTGIYSLAQKIGTAIHMLITTPFQSVFEPKRFEIAKSPEAKLTFNSIFIYHAIVLVFVGLGISIFITEVIRLMVTPNFYRAGQLVPLIIFSMIIFGLTNNFEFGILWAKKTKYFAYVNGIVAIVNLCLNFILIWIVGIWGAVYASTIGIILQSVLTYLFGKKHYFIKFEFSKVVKLFFIAFCIYGLSLLVKTDTIILNIFLKCVLMLVFLAAILFMRIVPDDFVCRVRLVGYSYIKPFISLLNSKGSLTKK